MTRVPESRGREEYPSPEEENSSTRGRPVEYRVRVFEYGGRLVG